MRSTHLATVVVAALVTAGVVQGCASDTSESPGQALARSAGCAGCHGSDGGGGLGPTWKKLYQSTVTLKDGTTVTADRDYLRRSITDPTAQQVKGYGVMPEADLSKKEVEQLVDYIVSLG